jgi:PilZ domain
MSFGRRQPGGYLGLERRSEVRQRADVDALMLMPTLERITGRVIDLSTRGARLQVASAFALPDTFDMRVQCRTYRAKVVRRQGGQVGLRFL